MIRRKSLMTCCTGTGLTACPTLFSFQDQGRPTDRDSAVPIPIINERLFVFISVKKKDGKFKSYEQRFATASATVINS